MVIFKAHCGKTLAGIYLHMSSDGVRRGMACHIFWQSGLPKKQAHRI
jgi:hypothetical protein